MKKKLYWGLLLLLLGAFTFYSCSSKDDVPQGEDKTTVSFEFESNTLVESKANTNTDPVLCVESNVPMNMQIVVKNVATNIETTFSVPVSQLNGKYKTDPYELPAGAYKVMSVLVYNSSAPAHIIYAGVKTGAPFAMFVPAGYLMEEQEFALLKFTKPTVGLYVLCVKENNAADFGMPKFEISPIEVICFDLFFNVCDEFKEHFVGAGTISVLSAISDQVLYSDTFAEGNIGTICFANNLELPDRNELYKIKVDFNSPYQAYSFMQEITVEQLMYFQQWTNWDVSMNAVHVVLCDPQSTEKRIYEGMNDIQ
ncbi:MAG: hypothetical protein ACRCX4_13595 [Bacteroidales bacterium]